MKHSSSGLLLLSSLAHANYTWPGQYDQFEDILAIHSGYRRFGFSDLVAPCDQGSGLPGVINAAEWIRTAFHDTITHSKTTGLGGLDASIMFELNRVENGGAAFNNTLGSMRDFITPRTSVSDMIALAVVVSSAGCGGPNIPLRLGRVDATEAGPSGVPEAHTDLKTALGTFSNAGFNQEDMITLVACGHTLGRVHSVDHPELVQGEPTESNVANFDTTGANFDNRVVTEYFDNSTANPLIISKNETLNSDKRIFSSDQNATMRRLQDPATFQKQCAALFERMINTVPSGIKLSEPLEIADVKPYIDTLELQQDGSLFFKGSVRVRTTSGTGRNADDLEVNILFKDRSSKDVVSTVSTQRPRLKGGQSSGFRGEQFTWFEFSTAFNATTAPNAFDIELKDISTNATTIFENGGSGGYPVETKILYQKRNSCLDINSNPGKLTVVAAIRASNDAPVVPRLRVVRKVPRPGVMIQAMQIDTVEMIRTDVEKGEYVYYQSKVDLASDSWSSSFDVRLDNDTGVNTIKLTTLSDKSCGTL